MKVTNKTIIILYIQTKRSLIEQLLEHATNACEILALNCTNCIFTDQELCLQYYYITMPVVLPNGATNPACYVIALPYTIM